MPVLLFPTRCPVCDGIAHPFPSAVCPACRDAFLRAPERARLSPSGISGFSVFSYESVKESLHRFKYGGRADYAAYYAQEMAALLSRAGEEPSLFVPVPVSAGRLAQRGYNQAALLAGELSRVTDIPWEEHLLVRGRETPPLSGESPEKRRKIMKNAISVNGQYRGNDVKWKAVYLVDDIFTTGATVDACAAALYAAGASKVCFVTVGAVLREEPVFSDD